MEITRGSLGARRQVRLGKYLTRAVKKAWSSSQSSPNLWSLIKKHKQVAKVKTLIANTKAVNKPFKQHFSEGINIFFKRLPKNKITSKEALKRWASMMKESP